MPTAKKAPTGSGSPSSPKTSYYSSRSKLIKWIVIYLVIGAVAYAAIYFIFLQGGSSSSNGYLPY